MRPAYITREQLMAASEVHTTSLRASQIDRLISSASQSIDDRLHRHFYPLTETVIYSFRAGGPGFWLHRDLLDLISAKEDGAAVSDVADVELYPSEHGPPFSWIGLTGSEVEIEGVWGFSETEVPAGQLAAVADHAQTDVAISDASLVGVGDLIRIDTERMIVTARRLRDTGADLASSLSADVADDVVALTSGMLVHPGEVITLGAERLLAVDIAGNDLIAKRAWDGSRLAVHSSGADVFSPRTLIVEREAVGTTAASHSESAPIRKNMAPEPVRTLCLAEALTSLHQETSAYGRVIGGGEAQMEARGLGLADARRRAKPYRRMRMAAV